MSVTSPGKTHVLDQLASAPAQRWMRAIARGGPRSKRNVQLTHLRRNTAKGNRAGCDQLRIFG